MRVNSKEDALETLNIVHGILLKSNKRYQVFIASGVNVHTYYNLYGIAQGRANLLRQALELDKEMKEIQSYVDLSVSGAYNLAKWVGEQLDSIKMD